MSETRAVDAPLTNAMPRLLLARALRDFADGFIAVLLPVYLTGLGYSAVEIGVVASVALAGSALTTLAAGFVGARFEHRRLLVAASILMVATGLVLMASSAWAVILVVAFAGTLNPQGGSVSVFVPFEHAVLTRDVPDTDRTRAFARYGLVGALAAAVGAFAAATPDLLGTLGVGRLTAFRAMFALYAALGLAGAFIYASLPAPNEPVTGKVASVLGPSKSIVVRLAALFSLDSFAGGFVVQSLLALWLFQRFGLSLTATGLYFFWAGVLAAFSFPVAAWISDRIGLVQTMVWTHIPSSLLLIIAAFAPTLEIAIGCLLVRAGLSQMDVPTRSSYVMAVVTPPERAAAASFTSVPRSLAAAVSPALAGLMFTAGYIWLPLVLCGVLKIIYDLMLLWAFRHIRPPEEQGR